VDLGIWLGVRPLPLSCLLRLFFSLSPFASCAFGDSGLVGLVGYFNSVFIIGKGGGIRNGVEASDSEGPPRKASRAGLGSGSDGRTRQCYHQWVLYDVVDWVVGPPSRLGVWDHALGRRLSFVLAGPSDLLPS